MDDWNKDLESMDAPQTSTTMDDINELLRKAGLSPIGEEPSAPAAPAAPAAPVTPQPKDEEKTRHFSLPKTPQTTQNLEETRVLNLPKTESVTEPAKPKNDSQLMLDGFAEEETPRHVSEEEMEAQLKHRRKNLVENFRVLSQDEEDQTLLEKETAGDGAKSVFDALEVKEGEPLFDAVAQAQQQSAPKRRIYFDRSKLTQRLTPQPEEQQFASVSARREALTKFKKTAKITLIAQTALFAAALLLMVCASFYLPGGALEFLFGHGARPFTFTNLLLILVAAGFSKDTILRAINDVKAQRVSAAVCTSALAALSALHAIWMLIATMDEGTGYISFAICGVFAFFAQTVTSCIAAYTEDNDLTVLQNSETLQELRPVENIDDATALGHGISTKKSPNIFFASPVNGSERTMPVPKENRHEKVYLYSTLVAAGLSLLFALVRSISERSAALFINAFVSCAFLCVPFLRGLLTVIFKTKNDAALSSAGVVVASLESAETLAEADAVVVGAEDLFDAKVANFRAVPGGRMSKQDAAIYAAAALQDSNSLLAGSFSTLAQELDRRIPLAEDLNYEEKLGYSCWVAGRRVLVGNRDMLVQHSVPAPTAEEERAYAGKREVLYVAVEGLVAATFTVSYRVKGEARRTSRVFDKAGLLLMLSTGDPGLTEEYVAQKLALDVACVKLMSTKNTRLISELQQTAEDRAPTGLFTGGKRRHLLILVNAAHRLFEADKLGGIVQLAGHGVNFLGLMLCVIFKTSSFFMPLTVLFLHLFWCLASYLVGSTRMK